MANDLIPIQNMIYEVRGQRVMLDSDLAMLYEVETRVLVQAVKRNIDRFPPDFMFQLTQSEFSDLISQIVISSWGGKRKLPYAFTEQGVSMLTGVLKSKKAISVNIQIMRAFVQFRHYALSHKNSTDIKIAELEKLLMLYIEKNDDRVNEIIIVLNNLIAQPRDPKKIGFCADNE